MKGSLVIKDIKSLHKKAMMKHHIIIGVYVVVEYVNDAKGKVKCTFSEDTSTLFLNGKYVDKNVLSFVILKQNLIDSGLPIKGFKKITLNRREYEVLDYSDNSSMGNTIIVRCEING